MPALALTDHGSLFGAVEFYQEARNGRGQADRGHGGLRHPRQPPRPHPRDRPPPGAAGARRARLQEPDAALFARVPRGLLLQAARRPRDPEPACRGAAGALGLPQGRGRRPTCSPTTRRRRSRPRHRYRDMFGAENYFLEIQNHGLEIEDEDPRQGRGPGARAPGSRWSRPTTATTCSTRTPTAHDVLLCIQTGKIGRRRESHALRDRSGLLQVGRRDARALQRPSARRCATPSRSPSAATSDSTSASRCCPSSRCREGRTSAEDYLRELAAEGVRQRFSHVSDEARKRLEYELDVICRMGFASYFLIVRDFIALRAQPAGIGVGPGRGSVAGSLVAYALRHHRRRPAQARALSSSASSTPSACRCPTSTSTSTICGAARSSST